MIQATDPELLRRAKSMRTNMTQPERELWIALRGKRFNGVKVRRQEVIGPYIVDFLIWAHRLVIEVDGDAHSGNEAHDARRTDWLELQGYRVIRFANGDVIDNLEGVLQAIGMALDDAPLPNPLPHAGEGLSFPGPA